MANGTLTVVVKQAQPLQASMFYTYDEDILAIIVASTGDGMSSCDTTVEPQPGNNVV